MKLTLYIQPETYVIGKNLHNIIICADHSVIAQGYLNLDEIEELEHELINIEQQLASYRREKQK